MTDEPIEGGESRPKIFNKATGWIGGVTAVVLALAGLKTAYNQLTPSAPVQEANTEATETAGDEGTPVDDATATDTAAATGLPTKYTGTWQGKDVTLQWRNGVWVETTAEGTDDEIIVHYEQLSQTDVMTNAIDRSRNLYVRWPSSGGTLEESEDGITWTRSYEVAAA